VYLYKRFFNTSFDLKLIVMNKKLLFIAALLSCFIGSLQAQLPPSLLQRFTFNNTYYSVTQTANFIANSGTSFVQDRNGNANSALQINNTGTIAEIYALPIGINARTVSLWVKITSFNSSGFNFIFNYGNGITSYGAYLDQISVKHFGNNTNHNVATTNTLNEWVHYAFTYNGTISRVYRNGIQIGTQALSLNTHNNNNIFRLGLSETGGSTYFVGAIDDLEIYNRALTANEIYELYGSNATPVVAWDFTGTTSSTTGLYPFSTSTNTFLNNDRFNVASRALYINNSGSVATGVAPLPTGNAARTISFWFKRSQSDFQELFVYGSSGGGSCFGLYVTANGSFVNYYTNNGSVYAAMSGSPNQPIAPDTWHFITVVYTQDSSNIYRNGIPIAQFSNNVTLTTVGTNLRLGMVLTTSQNPFQGTIDEIKVYNGALSPAEIAASYNASLPTHLTNFTAQLKNDNAQLFWNSQTETNTSHFNIEYSNNARDYTTVGEVQAAGNSSINKQYSFSHAINKQTTHYYRLKMVDKDGSFTYSNVVKLQNNGVVGIELYPNPVKNQLNISYQFSGREEAVIRISNIEGKVVQTQKMVLEQQGNVGVDVSRLTPGVYVVEVITANNRTVKQVMKE
jgi:hypothetical protein